MAQQNAHIQGQGVSHTGQGPADKATGYAGTGTSRPGQNLENETKNKKTGDVQVPGNWGSDDWLAKPQKPDVPLNPFHGEEDDIKAGMDDSGFPPLV